MRFNHKDGNYNDSDWVISFFKKTFDENLLLPIPGDDEVALFHQLSVIITIWVFGFGFGFTCHGLVCKNQGSKLRKT